MDLIGAYVSMTITGGDDAGTYYYNQDERSSVRNLTDSTGAVVNTYEYTAFGEAYGPNTDETVTQRYQYTGRELNSVAGNHFFRYRTYSAGLGAFATRDPLGYVDGTSLYAGYFGIGLGADPWGTKGTDMPAHMRYSCNCGWIDTGHMRPDSAEKLWEQVSSVLSPQEAEMQMQEGAEKLILYKQSMARGGMEAGIVGQFYVKQGLEEAQKERVALYIFWRVSMQFELLQGEPPWSLATNSSSAEGDLVSNLLGFYMAVRGYTKKQIYEWCDVRSKTESEHQWKLQGGLGKNYFWTPMLHDYCPVCPGGSRFPERFREIKPVQDADLVRLEGIVGGGPFPRRE